MNEETRVCRTYGKESSVGNIEGRFADQCEEAIRYFEQDIETTKRLVLRAMTERTAKRESDSGYPGVKLMQAIVDAGISPCMTDERLSANCQLSLSFGIISPEGEGPERSPDTLAAKHVFVVIHSLFHKGTTSSDIGDGRYAINRLEDSDDFVQSLQLAVDARVFYVFNVSIRNAIYEMASSGEILRLHADEEFNRFWLRMGNSA